MTSNFEVSQELLPEEIIRLGLADSSFLVPSEQVKARFGVDEEGQTKMVVYVSDIDVLSLDPVTKDVKYRITGLRQFVQNWDVGGSNLDPTQIGPDNLEVSNG